MPGGMADPYEFIRTLAGHLLSRRQPAEVIGYANGTLAVAVEGRVANIAYAGTDELKPGHKVWLRKNPEDPHGSYSYEGFRLQGGSISSTPGDMQGSVSEGAVSKHVIARVIDGNNSIVISGRKYIEFRGGVTVTDDPAHDKVIIDVFGWTGGETDYDDPTVDYDAPGVAYGG